MGTYRRYNRKFNFLKENPTIIVCSTLNEIQPGPPGDHENCPAYDVESNRCYYWAWFKAKAKPAPVVGPLYECPREETDV